jgi:hypothetical protein
MIIKTLLEKNPEMNLKINVLKLNFKLASQNKPEN